MEQAHLGVRLRSQEGVEVGRHLPFRTDVYCGTQILAEKVSGLSSAKANQTGFDFPSNWRSGSPKADMRTRQRCSGESHQRQCGDAVLRTFVAPGSVFLPRRTNAGDGDNSGGAALIIVRRSLSHHEDG